MQQQWNCHNSFSFERYDSEMPTLLPAIVIHCHHPGHPVAAVQCHQWARDCSFRQFQGGCWRFHIHKLKLFYPNSNSVSTFQPGAITHLIWCIQTSHFCYAFSSIENITEMHYGKSDQISSCILARYNCSTSGLFCKYWLEHVCSKCMCVVTVIKPFFWCHQRALKSWELRMLPSDWG